LLPDAGSDEVQLESPDSCLQGDRPGNRSLLTCFIHKNEDVPRFSININKKNLSGPEKSRLTWIICE
jgi:hypothetical protein